MEQLKHNKFYNAELAEQMDDKWNRALSVMQQRTAGYSLFSKVSHNQSIYDQRNGVFSNLYSEGSTQAIKRKIRAQTIQRVPDGEISTQFDKNSIEQVEIEFLFKAKILRSEFQGADMLKNIWKTFGAAYDYGFCCVRSGFERDTDGDIRTSYTNIPWNDVYPSPDCHSIEDAEWYIIREYVSRSELESVYDKETKTATDPTYNDEVLSYIIEEKIKDGIDPMSLSLQDKKKGSFPIESLEVRTLYKRGDNEFITYVPRLGAELRRVKNYDPRKDVPLHFLILDPDPEFPLGCSSIMWTLPQQQFADAFQSLSYDTLLLATQPPLMGFGNLTPSKIKMKPRSFWPMGTNPNNKIEKFPVETTTITQYNAILEGVQARMMSSLNIADGTIASDANSMGYSKTAPGVAMQKQDKTVTINQFQKQTEVFFSQWANHALRSYVNSMSGTHELTVNEETRRKIWDIEMSMYQGEEEAPSIVNGDKISIDFDALSTDLLSFEVRAGSLIESEKDIERKNIQEALVPISQMLNAVSEQNKEAFENVLMKMIARLLEMSDIDISQQTADTVNNALLMQAMQATMEQVMMQQQQINQLAGGQPLMPMEQPGMQQQPQQPAPSMQQQMPPAQPMMDVSQPVPQDMMEAM